MPGKNEPGVNVALHADDENFGRTAAAPNPETRGPSSSSSRGRQRKRGAEQRPLREPRLESSAASAPVAASLVSANRGVVDTSITMATIQRAAVGAKAVRCGGAHAAMLTVIMQLERPVLTTRGVSAYRPAAVAVRPSRRSVAVLASKQVRTTVLWCVP